VHASDLPDELGVPTAPVCHRSSPVLALCVRSRPMGRSAKSRRSTLPRTDQDARRWTKSSHRSAVELRLNKLRRGLAPGLGGTPDLRRNRADGRTLRAVFVL